jgi:hypothetical protein
MPVHRHGSYSGEAVWRGIEKQDNGTTRAKLSKSWGICQVIDKAKLATTYTTQRWQFIGRSL